MSQKKPKPLSPLQAMTMGRLSPDSTEQQSTRERGGSAMPDKIISVDPSRIANWTLHDRPETELGNLDLLAKEMKELGQQQPCIVRPYLHSHEYDYEVIAGERRWRAAEIAGIKLNVIVKELTDKEAALCQAAENSQREDLSEYARGTSYANMIHQGLLTRGELQEKLNVSKSQIRNLLSFAKIPQDIWTVVKNPSLISAATAYEIARLLEKGENYREALTHVLANMGNRGMSDKKLAKKVEDYLAQKNSQEELIPAPFTRAMSLKFLKNGNLLIELQQSLLTSVSFESLNTLIKEEIEKLITQQKQALEISE